MPIAITIFYFNDLFRCSIFNFYGLDVVQNKDYLYLGFVISSFIIIFLLLIIFDEIQIINQLHEITAQGGNALKQNQS